MLKSQFTVIKGYTIDISSFVKNLLGKAGKNSAGRAAFTNLSFLRKDIVGMLLN